MSSLFMNNCYYITKCCRCPLFTIDYNKKQRKHTPLGDVYSSVAYTAGQKTGCHQGQSAIRPIRQYPHGHGP